MLQSCLPLVVAGLCAVAAAQESRAVFDAPLVVLPADSPPFQRLFDYDADGDLDVVGHRVRSDGNEFSLWDFGVI